MTRPTNKPIGRPPGSKNVDSLHYQEYFIKRQIVVPQKEEELLNECWAKYKFLVNKDPAQSPLACRDAISFLRQYQELLRDIANRIYPKLRSIDVTLRNSSEGKTKKEKVEAARQLLIAVEALPDDE